MWLNAEIWSTTMTFYIATSALQKNDPPPVMLTHSKNYKEQALWSLRKNSSMDAS